MEVKIKDFTVEMDVKNKGIEFEVRDNNGKFLGDCYVTKTGLEWCEGKTPQGNGKKIGWASFISKMTPKQKMPKGPKGEKRPADASQRAVMVARIATGKIEHKVTDDGKNAAAVTLVRASRYWPKQAIHRIKTGH